MSYLLKVLTVVLFCSLFFSKLGMPAAVILFKFDFLSVFIASNVGGIGGSILFTYVSAGIIKWWKRYKHEKLAMRHPKVFTKANRRIIRIKNRFGLTGIAILTPVMLSMPLGAFLGERFYKKKSKVILYLSVSTVFWSVAFYFIYYFFYDALKGWFF